MKAEVLWKGWLLSLLLLFLWTTWPMVNRSPHNKYRQTCLSNQKTIAQAFALYAQDNMYFPPALNSNTGLSQTDNWAGIVFWGGETKDSLRCPIDEAATDSQKTSYGYNANLGGKYEDALYEDASNVILNFEVVADADNWTQTGKTPAAVTANKRHLDGSNFSFVDGHAKWLKFSVITGEKPHRKNFTFVIR